MAFNTVINYGSFAILSILWLGFGGALLFNQPLLDTLWQTFRGLPLAIQLVLGLLLLPLVLGLWIWQSPWPLWIRLMLVIGLGWTTIYTFFPKHA
ncbi:MAG: hypothetical protein ACM3Y8_07915 [Byssovorax cruenta]